MKSKIITFPWIGKEYTEMIKEFLENLGLNIQLPPKTTDNTIKLGVKNSAGMFCYPLKTTLGNFIEALDNGADTLLMIDSRGICTLRHYYKVQEHALRKLGYDFEMHTITKYNIFSVLSKLSGKSKIKIFLEIYRFYKKIRKYDLERFKWSKEKPNIGIIGEAYTCMDETSNYNIEDKIKKLGANPYNTVTLLEFFKEGFMRRLPLFMDKKKKYKKEARKYLNGKLGGHGEENIFNLLHLIDKKVDGIIHLMPLTCRSEVVVEKFIDSICRDNKIPLLRINIDENNSELNLNTRLETFLELIRLRKEKKIK